MTFASIPARTAFIAPLLGLLGALAVTACKKDPYPACRKDKDCTTDIGEVCVSGMCQNCTTDADCDARGDGLTCVEFRCAPADLGDGGVASGADGGEDGTVVGAACAQRTDCGGGLSCTAGTCQPCHEDLACAPYACNLDTNRCDPMGSCQADNDCTADEICDGGMCVYSGPTHAAGVCGLDAVYFAFDSSAPTPGVADQLEQAAACLVESGQGVTLEAHADNVGTEEYNIMLTERRGRGVADVLVSYGVPRGQLEVIAKGNLEANGATEGERAKDRRVDLIAR
ncbi:MAG: OmpA family protein [Myxococcota bacterium]